MPQDHASWDRKELLRQRKHERPEQSFDSAFRWRESPSTPSSHHVSREFSRWGSGDFRRPSCYGKQGGGRNQFVDDASHAYTSSRSSARMLENDYYRSSASRGDWRYTRNGRDDRISLSHKEWKCNTWEMSNGSSRGFERSGGIKNGRRSVDERPPHASDTHNALVNSGDPANTTHQPDIEVCTPSRTLKVKSDQKFPDQRLSLPSNPHSDCVNLCVRPCSEKKSGNKTSSPVKQCSDFISGQRLANDSSLDPSIPHAELEETWGQLHLQDPHDDKLHGTSDLDVSRKYTKDSSLGPIGKCSIWTRSGSFASRGSGFSHSSSSKSLGAVDSSDWKNEILPKTVAVTQSSSGDAAACVTTTHMSEDLSSRKKPRLGWGEGLAKYEKKKVDVNTNEDGTPLFENRAEELHSLDKSAVDKSPTVGIVPDYGSPATPSSMACSSSLGFAEKSSAKAVIASNDTSNMCRSPSPVSSVQGVSSVHLERFPVNIEELDDISMGRFSCLLNELLGTDDSGSGGSSSAQLTAVNRLLTWKADTLKAVEMTESEIDLLENEYKMIKLESGRYHCLVGPSSYHCEGNANVPKEQEAPCTLTHRAEASFVPETVVRSPFLPTVLADVPLEGSCGTVEALCQSLTSVKSAEDILHLPSIKVDASSKEINSSATANQEIIQLSSGDYMDSDEDRTCANILNSNKKSASEATEIFNHLLPREISGFDDSRSSGLCQSEFESHIKEKVADRIELLRAREKILLLQFKTFQLAWKKDLQQLALTKFQSKSSKKTELYLHAKNNGHLKLTQSVRPRFSSPAPRRISQAPTTELISYMEKLLPSIHLKPFRDILRMPAMILDEKERVSLRFISTNGLIVDPCDVEKEKTMINPWTSEEKETFLNKLAVYGKDFKKIASYLTQKTTADCIEYYYKNHKSDCFGKIKKQRAYGKEGKHTYMLAPRKKWKREMGAGSLDILGAVSMIAANAGKAASTRQISSKRITLRGCSSSSSFHHDGNNSEGCSYSFDFPHKKPVGADALPVGPLSSEQMNSCLRTSLSSRKRCMDHLKFDPVVKKPRISHTAHIENSNEEDDSYSEESCGETGPIHWTDDERSAFIQGFSLYGKNFALVSRYIGTRSQDQCRVFFSKVRKCLGLESIQFGSGNVSTSASVDNGNEGGGSDMEDPCALESSSGICKMDMNSPTSPFNINHDGSNHSDSANVKVDLGRSDQETGLAYLRFKDNTNLLKDPYINGSIPGLVSESSRDLVNIKTVESRAAEKIKSNDLPSLGTKEGIVTSVAVSSEPSSCGPSVLANVVVESPTETSRKGFGGQGLVLPKQNSKNHDGVMQAANRIRNSGLDAEAAPSGFRYPECLHHVPIQLCMEDPVGVSLPRGNPNFRTEFESSNSFVGQVLERHNLGSQSSNVNLDPDGRFPLLGHANHELSDQVKATNPKSCQVTRISFTQDPSKISRSKSDLIVKTQRTGEGFSLIKCTGLSTNGGSAAKPLSLSFKNGRSGHNRSHSCSLSDRERPDKSGDVKLFGTILTAHENGSKHHKHNQCGSVSTRECDTQHEYINQHALQNVPIMSYDGLWDGNKIRTGLTSLPESTKSLARYPEAFSTPVEHQIGSSKEMQQLHRKLNVSVKQADHNKIDASSAKDAGNIGVDGVAEAIT